jgi:hypothetical protein
VADLRAGEQVWKLNDAVAWTMADLFAGGPCAPSESADADNAR